MLFRSTELLWFFEGFTSYYDDLLLRRAALVDDARYLKLLAAEQPGAPWIIAGLGVELGGLIEHAVLLGGHVRVGLEDAHMGCSSNNLDLLRDARRRIERSGAALANATQVREALRSADARQRAGAKPEGVAA